MDRQTNLIDDYLAFACNNESPAIYHRWSCISALGAMLGRRLVLKHGHQELYPNFYTILLGTPGVRKSTAIKMVGKILRAAGYNKISTGKTTKEKFILDLAEYSQSLDGEDNMWAMMGDSEAAAERLILADEMNDFFGNNILEFVSFLGTLWDYEGPYESRIKNGPSAIIHDPTISFLAGTTPGTFAATFPPEIIGQGFFSRTLLIHGEPNGKRIAFPKPPSDSDTARIVAGFKAINSCPHRTVTLERPAELLLEKIYNTDTKISDPRFATYRTRRFTHLLKLCIIIAGATDAQKINTYHVIYANTVLHYAEQFMPRALGEFGRAKSSAATDKVISTLESSIKVWSNIELWTVLSSEFESISELAKVLANLAAAGKVSYVDKGGLNGSGGFIISKRTKISADDEMVQFTDYELLTDEERKAIV